MKSKENIIGDIKEYLKDFSKYILVFIIVLFVFLLSLFLSSLIPSKYIEENVRKSSEILKKDGEKVTIDLGYKEENLFYFTDAIMLNTAYSIDSNYPIKSMLLDRKNYIPGQTQIEHEEAKYHIGTSPKYVDEYHNTYQVEELYGLMHGENIVDSYEYTRYWHGYLVFLRPLLLIMDLGGIRILLQALIFILCISLIILIIKRINIITAIIYMISLLLLNLNILANSMSDVITFIIALVSAIFILVKKGQFIRPALVFMVIGSVTSFLDLLTTPIVTIGLTLPLYILLNIKRENKDLVKEFIKSIIAWCIGYGLMWVCKWIITDIILNKNVIENSINQLLYRIGDKSNENIEIPILNVIMKNLYFWKITIPEMLIGIILIYILVGIGIEIYNQKIKKVKTEKIDIIKVIIFLILAISPFVWYSVIKNHSYVHSFFTYRDLIVFILNIQIAVTLYFGYYENETIKRNNN